MSELGSIFEPQDAGRPRGADVRIQVEVPSRALGDPAGFVAPVPDEVEVDGRTIARAVAADERGQGVRLHLPEQIRPGTVLRLRGQGGAHPEGSPGDLYVEVSVVPSPEPSPDASPYPSRWTTWWVLAATGLAGGASWLAWTLLG